MAKSKFSQRIHNYGPWDEHLAVDHYDSSYLYRVCEDCGQSQRADYRVLCDIR